MLLLEVNLDSLGAVEEETTLECSAPGDINHHEDGDSQGCQQPLPSHGTESWCPPVEIRETPGGSLDETMIQVEKGSNVKL